MLRDRVDAIFSDLQAAMQRRHRMDVIANFALPLPTIVIAEMLGVPAEHQHQFHRWSRKRGVRAEVESAERLGFGNTTDTGRHFRLWT
jgi:cytochrome P450